MINKIINAVKYIAVIFFLLLCEIILTSKCTAQEIQAQEQSGPVFFNELMWRGSSVSTADEWIELYNDSDEIVDISGWEIFDKIKGEVMVLIERGQIAPRSYFLIANNGRDHQFTKKGEVLESVLDIDPDIVESGISLNNAELSLSLRDSRGAIIDRVGDGKKPFFGEYCPYFNELHEPVCDDLKPVRIASMQRIDYSITEEMGTIPGVWQATSERNNNLDLPSPQLDFPLEYATPQNSGKPNIESVNLSSEVFFPNQLNRFEIEYKIDDPKDDLSRVYLAIEDDKGDEGRVDVPESGGIIELNYSYCPKFVFIAEDETGLTDEYELNLTCAYLNKSLVINEVMPHPKGNDWDGDGTLGVSDEWIELYNGSREDTELSGWVMKDKSGKEFKFDNLTIKAGSYLVLYKNTTKISINDDGDTIYLIDPTGKQTDVAIVPKSTKYPDVAFARFGKNWDWSKMATLGKKNVLVGVEGDTARGDDAGEEQKTDAPVVRVAVKTTQPESNVAETEDKRTVITTTTTVKRYVPTVLTNRQIAPIVLGSRIKRNSSPGAFIRFEYLLYLLGFVAFLLLTFCYEICRRE